MKKLQSRILAIVLVNCRGRAYMPFQKYQLMQLLKK